MDLDAYLRRIAWRGRLRVDADTLAALQRAHLLAVPFENLDIGRGVPIAIDLEAHYAKIVELRRGGFCYEQNHLFAWALGRIGFAVTLLGAGVWGTRDGIADFGDPSSHLMLRVDVDEPWIVDVGFGENFRSPLRLVDGLVDEQGSRAYRLDRHTIEGGEAWTLSTRDPASRWTPSYRFADVARPLSWFARMCAYHQTSPLSPFTQKRLCSLATAEGRLSLSGDEWIVTKLDGSRTVHPIADEAEAAALLKHHFAIDLAS